MGDRRQPRGAVRSWCAEAVFPGLKPFIVGTITMPADVRYDEIEGALEAHALTFLPPGFTIRRPLCGALFFHGEDNG